jgi:hypothetical protein
VAKSSNISKTLKEELSPDVASVSFLVTKLKQFFSSLSPTPDPGADLIPQSAEQYFAWLKESWERTNGTYLVNLKELDAAEKFIVDFFAPLLDGKEISDKLTDPSIFGTQALLEVPSSSVSLQLAGPLTRASFTGPPVPNFLLVYGGIFINIHDLLLAKGLPLDQVDAVVSYVMATILLLSFPIWTVYHELHGYAAFARVRDRLQASIDASIELRTSIYGDLVASAPPIVPRDGIDSIYIVSYLFTILDAAQRKKTDEYLPAFSTACETIKSQRLRVQTGVLMTNLKSKGFWTQTRGQKVSVNFGDVPAGVATVLAYSGQISYADTEQVQDRSYWAPQSTWDLLVKACQLISLSGFHVLVTALDNPYAGRHPPHGTHRRGFEVDLKWTFTDDPKDTIPDLAKSEAKYGDGPFFDVYKQQFFDLRPLRGGNFESLTQFGLAKLATLVAFQAVALAGVDRYLYLDFNNMLTAAFHLGLAIDPQLNPFSGGKRNIPFVEGLQHYNHLHIQAPDPAKPSVDARNVKGAATITAGTDYFTSEVLTKMYYLALLRDKDGDFLDSMFLWPPPDPKKEPTPEQEEKAKKFRKKWTDASEKMLPSLLPVWVTQEVQDRLKNGEKIETVLGIGR